MLNKLKSLVKSMVGSLNWHLAYSLSRSNKGINHQGSILLVPAGNLAGGFGEDVMVASFIANFSKGRPVTVFTQRVIERPDFLGDFKGVRYLGGFGNQNYLKHLNVLKEHTEVYVIGADIMDGTYGLDNSLKRLRILQLACRLGMEARISGFSVSDGMLSRVKKELLETSKYLKIKARDIDSHSRLATFIPSDRLILTNDIAFICPSLPSTFATEIHKSFADWCLVAKSSGRKIIGICPNSIQAKKVGLNKYISDFECLIKNFKERGDFSFVFLYHDVRPLCGIESDKSISNTLYKAACEKGIDAFFVPDIKNGVELKGYIESVDFSVTGRMHLGIAGLSAGLPMFGISYANKFEGMLRLFDINPKYCLISYTELERSEQVVDSFIANLENMKNSLRITLSTVKMETIKNY